jgi:tRNA threonylcarbamoyladenosine biosynthesis protein TsaB
MKILALETSSSACSVALLLGEDIHAVHKILPLQQAQLILPMIDELLKQYKVTLNQLNAIAFGCGPGSFTGVRIAASVAQGLAYALELPIIPISSLAALAQAAYETLKWKKLLVGVDARMQEVYWGVYEVNDQERAVLSLNKKEIVCAPEDLFIPSDGEWYGVGNAWDVYAPQIPYQPQAIDASQMPTAAAVLTLAREKYLKKDWVTARKALPVYLRDTVAYKKN